jgi:hypothetical protein
MKRVLVRTRGVVVLRMLGAVPMLRSLTFLRCFFAATLLAAIIAAPPASFAVNVPTGHIGKSNAGPNVAAPAFQLLWVFQERSPVDAGYPEATMIDVNGTLYGTSFGGGNNPGLFSAPSTHAPSTLNSSYP